MEEYIKNIDLDVISNQTLAFIGDSVHSLYIRIYLASKSNIQTGVLHNRAIRYVSAKAQSKVIDNIVDHLTEEELAVYKRGRNTNVGSISKHADVIEYKKATGYEALIGHLYITKNIDRLEEIIKISINVIEGSGKYE